MVHQSWQDFLRFAKRRACVIFSRVELIRTKAERNPARPLFIMCWQPILKWSRHSWKLEPQPESQYRDHFLQFWGRCSCPRRNAAPSRRVSGLKSFPDFSSRGAVFQREQGALKATTQPSPALHLRFDLPGPDRVGVKRGPQSHLGQIVVQIPLVLR